MKRRVASLVYCAVAAVALLASAVCAACAEETAESDEGEESKGGSRDAGLTEAGVDPNGGRDTDPASCLAACQNTAFTCQAKSGSRTTLSEAQVVLDDTGCAGTIQPTGGNAVALKVDCVKLEVCIGGTPGSTPTSCAPATFSAFTYGYTAKDGALTVCTRN